MEKREGRGKNENEGAAELSHPVRIFDSELRAKLEPFAAAAAAL